MILRWKVNNFFLWIFQDYIYHLAAGAVLVVGGILAITFAALALNWFPSCEDSALKDKCEDYRKTAFEPEFQLAAGVRCS